jgi:nucleotide-binding universal stress UspA family protein
MTMAPNTSGILVGVDGSEFSHTAVRWAVREAAMRREDLTLMTVAERHGGPVTYDTETMLTSRFAQHGEGDRILATARQIVDDERGDRRSGKVDTEFLFAHPLATLIDASKDMRLVVVGDRGMTAMDRLTLGSVSSGLVRHAHCPVAVIHKQHPEPDAHAPILLGIDGSPASELATAIAFDEASHRRAPLIAMHAWAHSFTSGAHLDLTIDEQKGDEALSERLAGWQENYPDVQVKPTVIHDDAGRWLVNHSDTAQLIVVGSHGRGGFAGMLLGSVSSAVVHAAEVPVIVARKS